MGVPVFIGGYTHAGKTYAIKDFKHDEVGVFEVAGKRLPFKTDIAVVDMEKMRHKAKNEGRPFDPYALIKAVMLDGKRMSYIIDDSQYLMSFEEMDSTKTGYDKFNSIGFNFIGLVRFVRSELPDDTIVYFLHHLETDEQGRLKAKTLGKLIDNHYTLEGLIDIVIYAHMDKTEHVFDCVPKSDLDFQKSPPGMLDERMPNDLKAVDTRIREFWGMAPLTSTKKKGGAR